MKVSEAIILVVRGVSPYVVLAEVFYDPKRIKWDEVHGEFGLIGPDQKVTWNEPFEVLHDNVARRLGFKHVGQALMHGYTKFINGSEDINIETLDTPRNRQSAMAILNQIGDMARPVYLDFRKPGERHPVTVYSKSFKHAGHAKLWLRGSDPGPAGEGRPRQ